MREQYYEEEDFKIFAHAASAAYITQMLLILTIPHVLGVPEYAFTMAVLFIIGDVIMLLAFAVSPVDYADVLLAIGFSMGLAVTAFILPAPVGIEVGVEWAYVGLVATIVYFVLAALSFVKPVFAMPILFTFPFPPLAAYAASHLFVS